MQNRLLSLLPLILLVSACNSQVYLRDGVTDGDTFYLAASAWTEDDPVMQSWVSYSLARSTCQLQIGGDNPARASSYDCEYTARRLLLQTWHEQQTESPDAEDEYLDKLVQVQASGHLDEYVASLLEMQHWDLPDDLEIRAFRNWQRKNLRGHKPQTRIIGSWNYAGNVSGANAAIP
jgi:hypothetical protein